MKPQDCIPTGWHRVEAGYGKFFQIGDRYWNYADLRWDDARDVFVEEGKAGWRIGDSQFVIRSDTALSFDLPTNYGVW